MVALADFFEQVRVLQRFFDGMKPPDTVVTVGELNERRQPFADLAAVFDDCYFDWCRRKGTGVWQIGHNHLSTVAADYLSDTLKHFGLHFPTCIGRYDFERQVVSAAQSSCW